MKKSDIKIRKKFSLIELLLVMFISALLLGIVIPAFHKITKGVSVEMAARQVGAQLKAVREYAITNREYVALIMTQNGDNTLPAKYRQIAYRPCIINSSDDSFSEWVYGERWEFLPEGSEIYSISPTTNIDEVDLSDIGGGVSTITSIAFSPTGKCLSTSAAPVKIEIVDSGVGDGKTYEPQKALNITVAAYTGRVSYGDD